MFSGNEWVIVVVALVVVAAVVWLFVRALRGDRSHSVSQARVRGEANDVLDDLQLATSGVSKVVTRRETPHSLTSEWTYVPGWAVVLAVVAFPIGLIALLARTSMIGTVIVRQESDGIVLMRMAGVFDKATAKAINSVIEARSRTPQAVGG